MTQSRTTRKATTFRVDTLLLAKYGILQRTRRSEAIVVNAPSPKSLTVEDKLDLFEFANFLMAADRQHDFLDLSQDEDEGLRDEV